jgi:hypothetical protein
MRLTKAPSLADEDFKRTVLAGDAVIDCVEIKLTRNVGGAALVYIATGPILFHPYRDGYLQSCWNALQGSRGPSPHLRELCRRSAAGRTTCGRSGWTLGSRVT